MHKHRLLLVMALILVLGLSAVQASFTVDVVPVRDKILPGEVAVFNVTVSNTGKTAEELSYKLVEDPSWSVITNPIFHQTSLKVPVGENRTTQILLTPDKSIEYGQSYDYNFKIASSVSHIEKQIILSLFVKSPNKLTNYVPIVGIDADVNSELDPRNKAELYMTVTNFNPLNITSLLVSVVSEVNPGNNRVFNITLPGLAKKELNMSLSYDPLQKPVKEKITITYSVPARNKTFAPETKDIQILPYAEIHKNTVPHEYFLKKVQDIKVFNDGNVNKQEDVRVKTSLFKQIFTSEEPAAQIVKEGGFRYYSWPLVLAPQESKEITITENYRPLFIIFVVLVVAFGLYRIFRSPVVIKKEAHRMKKADAEEEISMMKVQIHIKNRTGKIIENLNVVDKIPHIAVLDRDFPVGTLQPSKIIKHEKRGSIIKWVIPELEAYEERIITYNLSFKLKIIGGIRLSSAMVKYKNRINRFSKSYSNRISAR